MKTSIIVRYQNIDRFYLGEFTLCYYIYIMFYIIFKTILNISLEKNMSDNYRLLQGKNVIPISRKLLICGLKL